MRAQLGHSVQQRLPGQQATHRNHRLFSDHYLDNVLPGQREWEDVEGLEEAFTAIESLFRKRTKGLRTANEAQTEEDFVRPVLEILGHVFDVRPRLSTVEGQREPDYVFFESEKVKEESGPKRNTRAYYDRAVGLGDAKRWERPLDSRVRESSEDYFSNSNPNFQMNSYLGSTELRWGILTNGRLWRLYHTDKSRDLSTFYEVDLAELLEGGSLESFKYFYLFFRREALLPDAEGKSFLDRVLEARERYAQRVGEGLKKNVYEALRVLAQGFLRFAGNGLGGSDLPEIYDNCLTLLYRLLFVSFAENRKLLPMDNPDYGNRYSLEAVKREIAAEIDSQREFLPEDDAHWSRLKRLFGLIDKGSEKLGVPAYNGGLFEARQHPFLEKQGIGDEYLAKAVDWVGRARSEEGQLEAVDYGSLDVRHLGSIYEGLLEHKLRIAEEEMVAVKEKGKERVVAAREAEGRKVVDTCHVGEVYLVTDRGERKATGSYYTPDYIVKYIVENTLEPLVEGCKRPAEILNLKVLDPAMGSGHFLVEATDYLARALEGRYSEEGEWASSVASGQWPVTRGGQETGESREEVGGGGSEGRESKSLGVEESSEELKRRVVERCVYGVDLNPLAVELAKVSLWLHTAAKGKALSFLDHHLRCGNSLIGAWVKELGSLPERGRRGREKKADGGQMSLSEVKGFQTDVSHAVTDMRHLGEMPGDTRGDVKGKERFYRKRVEKRVERYRGIANLWCSSWFGNELGTNEYASLYDHYRKMDPAGDRIGKRAKGEPILSALDEKWKAAQGIGEEKRFFHWELEFPEVFFDEEGKQKGEEAGFDAVVANPPWVVYSGRQAQPVDDGLKALWAVSYTGSKGWLSTHGLFLERGTNLLRVGGRISYILPMQLVHLAGYETTRRALLSVCDVVRPIVAAGEDAFAEVTEPTAILTLQRKLLGSEGGVVVKGEFPTVSVQLTVNGVSPEQGGEDRARAIIAKMVAFPPLPARTFGDPGVHTGNSADLLLVSEPKLGTGCAEVREGQDVHRYSLDQPTRWLVTRPCLPADGYCTIRPREVYERACLLIRQTADRPVASAHSPKAYFRNSVLACYGTQSLSYWYLLAVLNSTVVGYFHRQQFRDSTQRAFPQVKVSHLQSIPVPQEPMDNMLLEEQGAIDRWLSGFERVLGGILGSESATRQQPG